MLQPWEQDQMEELTEEQIQEDCDEIEEKVERLYSCFIGSPRPEYYTIKNQKKLQIQLYENREEYEPTILEEALKLQKIIEMYIEYIVESGNFGNYSDKLQHLLSFIDDVICELQKFYKQLEKQYAIKLIERTINNI